MTASPGSKVDVFTLDEGAVTLQYPATLSETSFEDFKDWVELQLRKIKRSISKPNASPPPISGDEN